MAAPISTTGKVVADAGPQRVVASPEERNGNRMPKVFNVYLVCGFVAIGGGLFGMDISSMSGVIDTQAYERYFMSPRPWEQGAITASMSAGSLVGALSLSFFADRVSRRVSLQCSCVLWIVGSALQCGAESVPMLCAGRAIAGLCIGVASSLVPIYQSEVAPRQIRGRVVSLYQWAITWGILVQFFVQFAAAKLTGGGPDDPAQSEAAFRIPWGVQIAPAVVLMAGLFFLPYSPRWLASRDRWDDALDVLAKLHGGGNRRHPCVAAQYREIEDALRFGGEERKAGWRALWKGSMLKRVLLGMAVQGWSQLCGINLMMYYAVYIMDTAQITTPLLASSILYVINMIMTLPAILFLDRWGRRPSLLLGSLVMMSLLFVSGALQQYYGHERDPSNDPTSSGSRAGMHQSIPINLSWVVTGHRAVSFALVACTYLFVATFAMTWGPTSWTYPAEIFPVKVRAKAVGVSTAVNWAFNMALAFAMPPMLWTINYKTYYVFGACEMWPSRAPPATSRYLAAYISGGLVVNGVAFIHMYFTAYETKGYTLEEMDEVFDSGRPAWDCHLKPSRLASIERAHESRSLAMLRHWFGGPSARGGKRLESNATASVARSPASTGMSTVDEC